MTTDRTERFEPFLKALSAWIDLLADSLRVDTEAEDGWEIIPTPWYEGRLSDHVWFHLAHTVTNCEMLVENLERLVRAPVPEDSDDDFDILFDISPFTGGSMVEIKYMSYQFGPLYHNIMNQFLKYMSDEDFREALRSSLACADDTPVKGAAPFTPPPAGALANRLGLSTKLNESELLVLGKRLVDVWAAAHRFLAEVDQCERYLEGPVWVGLIALNALLGELLVKIVRLEPLWALFERAPYAGPS
jgi:hypothetical protein